MFENIDLMDLAQAENALRTLGSTLVEKRSVVASIFTQAGSDIDLMKAEALKGTTIEARTAELQAIQDEVDSLVATETKLNERRSALTATRDRLIQQRDTNAQALAGARSAKPGVVTNGSVPPHTQPSQLETNDTDIPAHVRIYSSVRNFKGQDAERRAYRFGQFILALTGNENSKRYCNENGIQIRALNEGDNAKGGIHVPTEFDRDIIKLMEEYGAARRNARIVPMKSNHRSVPRRIGGVTAYAVREGQTITESNADRWDAVDLYAKKVAAKVKLTSELDEDSVINIGDDSAEEIAQAFAQWEDEAFFNANGEATYHGVVGLRAALKNLDTTIANIAGLNVATGSGYGTNYNSVTLNDITRTLALAPLYARKNGKIYTSPYFYDGVMVPLLYNLGGVQGQEAVEGLSHGRYLGKPVELVQVMPEVSATNQVVMLYGDLRKAAMFGTRRELTLKMAETDDDFDKDMMTLKGTERIAINVHDVGNASATPALRKRGPVVGLITGAS